MSVIRVMTVSGAKNSSIPSPGVKPFGPVKRVKQQPFFSPGPTKTTGINAARIDTACPWDESSASAISTVSPPIFPLTVLTIEGKRTTPSPSHCLCRLGITNGQGWTSRPTTVKPVRWRHTPTTAISTICGAFARVPARTATPAWTAITCTVRKWRKLIPTPATSKMSLWR